VRNKSTKSILLSKAFGRIISSADGTIDTLQQLGTTKDKDRKFMHDLCNSHRCL